MHDGRFECCGWKRVSADDGDACTGILNLAPVLPILPYIAAVRARPAAVHQVEALELGERRRLPTHSEKAVSLVQKMQVGPCTPAGVQQ
jgi:hypothetical protein